jgi:hypothetical protein
VAVSSAIDIVLAASALPEAPASWAYVEDVWAQLRADEEIDLELWASGSAELTATRLAGAVPKPQVIADDDVDTVDFANDELDLTSHAYANGDGPVRLTTTDTLPAGLALATDYWVTVIGANSIQLHLTRAAALAGDTPVAFTDGGSGTHTISDTASTERLRWLSLGMLDLESATPGTVTLAASRGYVQRFRHCPQALAYALVGTVGSGTPSAAVRVVRRR